MQRNVYEVRSSRELRDAAEQLVPLAADMARLMVAGQVPDHPLAGRDRKAHTLDSEPRG